MATFSILTESELRSILDRELQPIKEQLEKVRKTQEPKELLTVNETSELLKVTPFTVRSYTKKGILTRYRFGSQIRYKRSEVLNAIERINNPKIK